MPICANCGASQPDGHPSVMNVEHRCKDPRRQYRQSRMHFTRERSSHPVSVRSAVRRRRRAIRFAPTAALPWMGHHGPTPAHNSGTR